MREASVSGARHGSLLACALAAALGPAAGAQDVATLLPFAADWEEAAERAGSEGKLILAIVQIYPGLAIPRNAAVSCFLEPELLDLVRERFVPLHVTRVEEVPFADAERYGMGPHAFGASALVATAGGDVVAETFLLGNSTNWLDEFLRGVLAERAEDRWDGSGIVDPVERAEVQARRGELEEARRSLRGVDSLRASLLRARIHCRLREAAGAREVLAHAQSLAERDGTETALRVDLEIARAAFAEGTRDLDAARAALEKARELAPAGPRVPEIMNRLGSLAWCRQDYARMRTLFGELVRDHPDSPWTWIASDALAAPGLEIGTDFDSGWPSDRLFDSLTLAPSAPLPCGEAGRAEREALERLLADQQADGSWVVGTDLAVIRIKRPDALKIAVTAIAAQALLSERAQPRVAAALERALAWARANVELARRTPPPPLEAMNYWPWACGYFTWFLADAVECGFGKRAELEQDMAGLFADLAARQQGGGGWSYLVATDPKEGNPPLHVSMSFTTGAIVTALERARSLSIAVPAGMYERAVACLEQARGVLGSFDYAIAHDAPRGLQLPQLIGASGRDAFLSHVLERAGHGRPGDVERALERFRSHLHELAREQGKTLMHCGPEALGSHYVFFDYANTARVLAESSAGRGAGPLRDELRERVLAARLADGSFIDNPLIGRAYGTAMALQALRFLRKD